jgi:hypothetical protein
MLTLARTDCQSCLGTLYVLQDNDTQKQTKQTKQTNKQTYTTNHTKQTNTTNHTTNKPTHPLLLLPGRLLTPLLFCLLLP